MVRERMVNTRPRRVGISSSTLTWSSIVFVAGGRSCSAGIGGEHGCPLRCGPWETEEALVLFVLSSPSEGSLAPAWGAPGSSAARWARMTSSSDPASPPGASRDPLGRRRRGRGQGFEPRLFDRRRLREPATSWGWSFAAKHQSLYFSWRNSHSWEALAKMQMVSWRCCNFSERPRRQCPLGRGLSRLTFANWTWTRICDIFEQILKDGHSQFMFDEKDIIQSKLETKSYFCLNSSHISPLCCVNMDSWTLAHLHPYHNVFIWNMVD